MATGGARKLAQTRAKSGILRGDFWNDTSTVYLLGQAISVEREALKIRHFEVLSNGFTPRLHLLKVNYPMNDESTLCDAGCFFNRKCVENFHNAFHIEAANINAKSVFII